MASEPLVRLRQLRSCRAYNRNDNIKTFAPLWLLLGEKARFLEKMNESTACETAPGGLEARPQRD